MNRDACGGWNRASGGLRRGVFLLCLTIAIGLGRAGERGVGASEGIGNFGRVDERLFRGAQPNAAGIQSLKRLGVRTIINLRQTNDVWKPEPAEARAQGITDTNIPMSGVGRPTRAQVETVLGLIGRLPAPVFVHCEHGCDRTGTIVACYRIRQAGWTPKSAQQEANRYGMSSLELGMRRFIADFAKAASHAEDFSPLGPPSGVPARQPGE